MRLNSRRGRRRPGDLDLRADDKQDDPSQDHNDNSESKTCWCKDRKEPDAASARYAHCTYTSGEADMVASPPPAAEPKQHMGVPTL